MNFLYCSARAPLTQSLMSGGVPVCAAEPGDLFDSCDRAALCDWCTRDHFSYDFLCCETGAWIGPHLTNPLALYLFWNSLPWAALLVLAFEVAEAFALTTFQSIDVLFPAEQDFETMAGALIGDALLQGGLGIAIGYALRVIFITPTLVSSPERAEQNDGGFGRRAVYVVVIYGLFLLSYLLPGQATSSGFRWGLLAQTLVSLALIFSVATFLNSDLDNELLWRRQDGTLWEGPRKTWFFVTWGTVVVLANVTHIFSGQPLFSVNEWFQQWYLMVPVAVLLLIIAAFVSFARKDTYTGLSTIAVIFTGLWVAMWLAYAADGSDAKGYLWVGAGSAAFAAILYIVAAFMTRRPNTVPGSVKGNTLPALQVTHQDPPGNPKQAEEATETTPLAQGQRQMTLRKRRMQLKF